MPRTTSIQICTYSRYYTVYTTHSRYMLCGTHVSEWKPRIVVVVFATYRFSHAVMSVSALSGHQQAPIALVKGGIWHTTISVHMVQ